MPTSQRSLALLALLAVATALTAQTTVTLPCIKDNTLYEDATGSLSNGAGVALFVGVTGQATTPRRRALLQFDVAGNVPAGSLIVNAELRIAVIQSAFNGALDVTGHRVLANWGEGPSVAPGGGGGGGPAATGDATWLHRTLPSPLWANAGGDYVAAASCTLTTQPLGIAASTPSSALVLDVQDWLDSPTANHGLLLRTNESTSGQSRKLDSRETTTGTAPSLVVTYLLPSQTTTWGTGCTVGAGPYQYSYSGAAQSGTTMQLVHTNGPANQLAANFLALELNIAGVALPPGCSIYLPLGPGIVSHSVVSLDAAGAASTPLVIPNGFPGLRIYAQAAALAPTPVGWVLSNAAIAFVQ
ncbi:MAG: hypothetical protein NXI31_04980 [bacterium]|nr:hypothetical protein [bacterium]